MVIGVTACVIGDMAARPNFGMNELDFVFSTLVVGSILNFTLMFLLAPTSAAGAAATLPGIFASSPTAGLFGTAISNGLLAVRKKLDPNFVVMNEAPPTILNAATWALHLGISSNLRYQSLNGIEMALGARLPPGVFKGVVFALRGINNIIGGVSFVTLAKLTGSQKSGTAAAESADAEKKAA
ncbi:unnamed protein product [Closterium sp. Naga37s-1]|nr:unnamed protein product [Closterium sp. Naga37s-1]